MKNANIRLTELFQKYLDDIITENELVEFLGYVEDPVFADDIQDLLGSAFAQGNEVFSLGDDGRKRVLDTILSEELLNQRQTNLSLWRRITIAAAIVVIVFSAGLLYYNSGDKQLAYKNDVAPGKIGATLTLANGKKISLNGTMNGELANEAGILISKSAHGELVYEIKRSETDPGKINTLSTAKGETYKVCLSDGSIVWLNAASSLTYTTDLNSNGKRWVKLEGEGYFEISKDKNRPFVVESKGQEVEVLGTHFNVNAYADESVIATSLFEGSVKVKAGEISQIIKPGEQAINNSTSIKIEDADIGTILDWKEGDFFLDRVDFRMAMRKIARWYNVEIIYDPSVPYDMISSGYISRSMKLSSVLRLIEKSRQVHFSLEGRTVHVFK